MWDWSLWELAVFAHLVVNLINMVNVEAIGRDVVLDLVFYRYLSRSLSLPLCLPLTNLSLCLFLPLCLPSNDTVFSTQQK